MEKNLEYNLDKIQELLKNQTEDNKNEIFKLAIDTERNFPNSIEIYEIIGKCYLEAIGVEYDLEKAIQYLKQAVNGGNTKSYYNLGLALYLNNDVECIDWLTKAQLDGNTDAMHALGKLYDFGEIVNQNLEKALYYYNCMLEAGDERALLDIGSMYLEDKFGTENSYKSFSYLKKYIDKFPDDDFGYSSIAMCYNEGIGTEVDYEKAEQNYLKAIELNSDDAEVLYEYGNLLKERGKIECIKYLENAFNNGNATSGLILFDIYTEDKLTKKNIDKAYNYINKAIEIAQEQDDTQIIEWANDRINNFKNLEQKNEIKSNAKEEKNELLIHTLEAIDNGAFSAALNYCNSMLSVKNENWIASFLLAYIDNVQVDCDNSDSAINNMQTQLNNLSQKIKQNVNKEQYSEYCNIIAKYTSKFCLKIADLQIKQFDELVSARNRMSRLSPIGFSNNYMYPRLEKMAKMLYNLGDIIEIEFLNEANDASRIAWQNGNVCMEMCKEKGNFFEKANKKATINSYKNKINKLK